MVVVSSRMKLKCIKCHHSTSTSAFVATRNVCESALTTVFLVFCSFPINCHCLDGCLCVRCECVTCLQCLCYRRTPVFSCKKHCLFIICDRLQLLLFVISCHIFSIDWVTSIRPRLKTGGLVCVSISVSAVNPRRITVSDLWVEL